MYAAKALTSAADGAQVIDNAVLLVRDGHIESISSASEANVPAGYELKEVRPTDVEATFSGPARAFYLLDRNGLGVTLDATLARLRPRNFDIAENDVRRPRDLTVVDLRPPQVRVTLRKAPPQPN